ncbi:MAG: ABC transporter ATP-binding protein [Verrucomicrobiota bacterium]|nr:ABC transporter ATP-binding protein [Limisphaera sp.]MDW8380611.1 ABC transporter ATP-binding protein [Verrucomicrobiota bacterium]
MLEIDSLRVVAGTFQLGDVTIHIRPGGCHVVLGPSGSGKSTLLQAVLGALPLIHGSIRLDGVDLTQLPLERRQLGYLPQQLALFPHLSVRENLLYSARARGLSAAQYEPLLARLISATRIESMLERRPATLSGGEQQRVGLVRALMGRPRLLLLDEPFSALNESLRRELWWLLRAIQKEEQFAILMVTHDLAEAYVLADELTVLAHGQVIQQGSKTEVYARPASPDVARLFGVETLYPGRILEIRDGLATVAVGSAQLLAPVPDRISTKILVSIRGEDVMLQPGPCPATSARNNLSGWITAIRPGTPLSVIELDVGFPLTALITRSACEELGLQCGTRVTALIKASAVHLIPLT